MTRTGIHKTGRKLHRVAAGCLAAALYVCASCVPRNAAPSEFFTLENSQWPYGKVLTFNAEGDSLASQSPIAVLSLKHTDDYAFANLWLELAYVSADSVVTDTFNVVLADEYGRWLGAGSGPVLCIDDTLRLGSRPDITSPFRLRHIMRADVVNEIEQVGLQYGIPEN